VGSKKIVASGKMSENFEILDPLLPPLFLPLQIRNGVLAFGRAIQLWAAGRWKQQDESSSRTIETAGQSKQQDD
jgi:hypothetical protein